MAIKTVGIVIGLLLSVSAFSQQRRYNTEKSYYLPPPSKQEIETSANSVPIPQDLKVPDEWLPFLNPAFEEFWSEGNHRPDAGFVLFARNPSKDNARLWLIRMEAKAKLLNEMNRLVQQEYDDLVRSGIIEDRHGIVKRSIERETVAKVQKSLKIMKDIRVYFIFKPGCGSCKKQAEQLLPIAGNVQPLQINQGKRGKLTNFSGLKKSRWAEKYVIDDYVKSKIPVIVVHNTKINKTYVLPEGRVHHVQQIIAAANHVSKANIE